MHADVFRRELADHWRALFAWSAGAVLLSAVYIFFYPSIHTSGAGIQQLLDSMPAALRNAFLGSGVSYLSPSGYLGTELFGFLVPVLLLVMGVLAGGRALAVALVAVALLAAGFGMLAFVVASATGSSGVGGGIAAALAVAMYVLNV